MAACGALGWTITPLVLKFYSWELGDPLLNRLWFALLIATIWLASAVCAQQPVAEPMLRHAIELHQAGDMEGAIREYRAYLKQVPHNVMARSNLGAALSRAGHYEEAITEYKQALDREPGNLPIRV